MEEVSGRIVMIVQARLGSKRLPGKILKEVEGKPLLAYQLERLEKVKGIHRLVVATPDSYQDEPILELCRQLGVSTFKGSEMDVLSRYYLAAKEYGADIVVRVTSDCVLIDPAIIDTVIGEYTDSPSAVDYVSNCLKRTFPVGMDTEVFSMKALEMAYKLSKDDRDREHVTRYIYTHPDMFALKNVANPEGDESHIHLAVDTEQDFRLIKKILEDLEPGFSLQDVMALLASENV
jgi:spore coat polysaccharide biosynthesis protein SpsF